MIVPVFFMSQFMQFDLKNLGTVSFYFDLFDTIIEIGSRTSSFDVLHNFTSSFLIIIVLRLIF